MRFVLNNKCNVSVLEKLKRHGVVLSHLTLSELKLSILAYVLQFLFPICIFFSLSGDCSNRISYPAFFHPAGIIGISCVHLRALKAVF